MDEPQGRPRSAIENNREGPTDRYDCAIEFLTQRPAEIKYAWAEWNTHVAGCLFEPVVAQPLEDPGESASPGAMPARPDGQQCGCLTQIAAGGRYVAWTDALTEAIRADRRIPVAPHLINPEHLPVFADWQRRIEIELRTTV